MRNPWTGTRDQQEAKLKLKTQQAFYQRGSDSNSYKVAKQEWQSYAKELNRKGNW